MFTILTPQRRGVPNGDINGFIGLPHKNCQNLIVTDAEYMLLITFRVSRKRRKMYIGHARLCVCVCVSLCLPVRRRILTLLHAPGCNLGVW